MWIEFVTWRCSSVTHSRLHHVKKTCQAYRVLRPHLGKVGNTRTALVRLLMSLWNYCVSDSKHIREIKFVYEGVWPNCVMPYHLSDIKLVSLSWLSTPTKARWHASTFTSLLIWHNPCFSIGHARVFQYFFPVFLTERGNSLSGFNWALPVKSWPSLMVILRLAKALLVRDARLFSHRPCKTIWWVKYAFWLSYVQVPIRQFVLQFLIFLKKFINRVFRGKEARASMQWWDTRGNSLIWQVLFVHIDGACKSTSLTFHSHLWCFIFNFIC